MNPFHLGSMRGGMRFTPQFIPVAVAPAEVGPTLVSPPSLDALTAQVGVPVGYISGVYSAGDAITKLPQFAINGVGLPDEFGPTFTASPGQEGLHLTITEVVTTGYGEDLVAVSRSVQIMPALLTAVPSAPTEVAGAAGTAGQALITWALPLTAADGSMVGVVAALTLYHGPNPGQQFPGGTGTTAISLSSGTTNRLVTGLPAGTRYFAVSASNSMGEGWTSYEVSVTVT
jgi:hypothetical protein